MLEQQLKRELSKIEPEELDEYLSNGWFRMQQTIFTTHKLTFNDRLYDAIWLRICLKYFEPEKKYWELRKRNSRFKIEIKKAVVTSEHEELFSCYRKNVSFEAAYSLDWLLFGDKSYNVYNTHMINLYNGKQLIGTGFFDLGKNSTAGICSIYHPDYKRYSIGKYIIYEKMNACKKKGFYCFYPGYFVPGYSPFNYKLEIGKSAMEYFDIDKNAWIPINNFVLIHSNK